MQNSDFPGATAFLVDLVSNRKIPITTPRCKVGRDDLNDIVISGDQSISRFHFVITKENSQYFVQDGKSRHGTFLNGNQISGPEPIHDGDVLKVGVSLFWFVIEAAVGLATSDKTQPVDLARDNESQPSSDQTSSTAAADTPEASGSVKGYDESLAPKPPEWSNNLENLASDSLGYSRQSTPSEPAPGDAKMPQFTDIAAEEFVPSSDSEEAPASSSLTDIEPVASITADQDGDAESSSLVETTSPVAESFMEPAAVSEEPGEPSSSGDSNETTPERSSSDSNDQDDSKFKISDNDINRAAERLLESYSDSSREEKSESSAEAQSAEEEEEEEELVAQETPSTEEREAEAEKTPEVTAEEEPASPVSHSDNEESSEPPTEEVTQEAKDAVSAPTESEDIVRAETAEEKPEPIEAQESKPQETLDKLAEVVAESRTEEKQPEPARTSLADYLSANSHSNSDDDREKHSEKPTRSKSSSNKNLTDSTTNGAKGMSILKDSAANASVPDWCRKYFSAELTHLDKELTELNDEVRQLQNRIKDVEGRTTLTKGLRNILLTASGDDLVDACGKIFAMMGWKVRVSDEDKLELKMEAEDKTVCIARVVWTEKEPDRSHLGQLSISQTRYWCEVGVEPKGILIIARAGDQSNIPSAGEYAHELSDYASKKTFA